MLFRKYNFLNKIGFIEKIYFIILLIGLSLRLWELDGRTLNYDEAIHLYYGWQLANTFEFTHSPWMHGPFQIELVALFIKIIGDNTFIARMPYALFGVVLIALPYFIRNHIGNLAAILISVLFIFSPIVSYFSRFGRNDIIIITLTLLLIIVFWKYIETQKHRYIYLTSALLALLLTTKETAYFAILFIGVIALGYGTKDIWHYLLCRITRKHYNLEFKKIYCNPAIGFFVLVVAIVLPHSAAAVSIPLRWIGIETAMPDRISMSTGLTGLPQNSDNIIRLGYFTFSEDIYVYPLLIIASIIGCLIYSLHKGKKFNYGICIVCISVVLLLWLVVGNAIQLISDVIPQHQVYSNGIDSNYGIALFIILAFLIIGSVVGGLWHKSVWLVSFVIFYAIWVTLYTTFFTNWQGIFTGSWQGLGYWLAQQEVARGGQPWYYYIVGLSAYELLCFGLGFVGIVFLILQKQFLGIVFALWAISSFMAYTIASERMPWLMINIIVPFIICAGIFISYVLKNIQWKDIGKKTNYAKIGALVIIVVLFSISTMGMFRASYVYNDRYKEILAYVQGSYDLKVDYYKYIDRFHQLSIDNQLWYPLQWYTRNDNNTRYVAFCDECNHRESDGSEIYLVHNSSNFTANNIFEVDNARRNLLWYPEIYRRNKESDEKYSFVKDVQFLITSLFSRDTGYKVLKYFVLREQDSDWLRSEYNIYANK